MRKGCIYFLTAVLLVSLLAGCIAFPAPSTEPTISLAEPYVGFAKQMPAEFSLDAFARVNDVAFDTYISDFSPYSGNAYFQTLSAVDRRVYRILQYAMDKAMPCILIDDRILAQMECSLEDILLFFSLDSAVVDQNMAWVCAEYTVTTTYESLFSDDRVEEHTGLELYISDFSPDRQDKKLQAIAKAEQILSQMPQGFTDREKAEYFYRYLGENVEYFLTEEQGDSQDYLYDALCVGKTNCDGYANAFSLLCSMSGIACLEKVYIPQTDETGHTWNAVQLDGLWYNVDATASDEVKEDMVILTHFGFSDALQEYSCAYTDRLPACTDALIPPDCIVQDTASAAKQIDQAFAATEKDYVLALFPDGAVEQALLQQIADTLSAGITTRHYIAADGTAVYYIYKTR